MFTRADLSRLRHATPLLAALTLSGTPAAPAETGTGAEADEDGLFDLERMIDQPRYQPYDPSDLFDDGKAMRRPPEGTVPYDRITGQPAMTQGIDAGAYAERIPVPVSLELLTRGQERFEIFCSPCHGVAGDGESYVANAMTLRRPPSLIDPRVQAFPPGRIYEVIVQGYGLMRSYEENIPLMDRWAIVAYLKALGRSRAVALDALPPPLRERATKELP